MDFEEINPSINPSIDPYRKDITVIGVLGENY